MFEINIKGLFGKYNYKLDFNLHGISIITGPNGLGKSTILKMIYELTNKNFHDFIKHEFKSFSIETNDSRIVIEKQEKTFSVNGDKMPYAIENPRRLQRSQIPFYYRRMSPTRYLNTRTGETVFIENIKDFRKERLGFETEDTYFYDVIDTIDFQNKNQNDVCEIMKKIVSNLNFFAEKLGTVGYIKEQRLIKERISVDDRYGEEEIEYVNAIELCSDSLKKQLIDALNKHSIVSNNLDGTYLDRLLKKNKGISYKSFSNKYDEVRSCQLQLQQYGLTEHKKLFLEELTEEMVFKFGIELSIYFDDYFKKFDVFKPIIERIVLFEKLVNKKLNYKSISINKDEGIVVKDENGRLLKLEYLSSGEQEIIVLFYKLIFENNSNILLIDEPEISLHIAWQKELLDDFRQIQNANKDMTIIVATHSPSIISNNWDLQIDLGEQING